MTPEEEAQEWLNAMPEAVLNYWRGRGCQILRAAAYKGQIIIGGIGKTSFTIACPGCRKCQPEKDWPPVWPKRVVRRYTKRYGCPWVLPPPRDYHPQKLGPASMATIEAIKTLPKHFTVPQLQNALQLSMDHTYVRLMRLAEKGCIVRVARGKYRLYP